MCVSVFFLDDKIMLSLAVFACLCVSLSAYSVYHGVIGLGVLKAATAH